MQQDRNTVAQADVSTAVRIEATLHRRTRMNAIQHGTTMTALVNRGLELANQELEKRLDQEAQAHDPNHSH
jgi:hypothetical protein